MSLRISSLCLAGALLAGCGTETPAPQGESLECAIGPGAEFAEVCTLERVSADEFVIHHPDGGFRRFRLDDQGEVILADSADQLVLNISPGDVQQWVELDAGGDRYRMPEEDIPRLSNE